MKDRYKLFPLLSELVKSILLLLLYINRLSPSLPLDATIGVKVVRRTRLTHRILNSPFGSLFLIKFEVSFLKVFSVRAIIFIIKVEFRLLLNILVRSLTQSLIWLSLKCIYEAWDIGSQYFLSLIHRVGIWERFDILHTVNHIVSQRFQ